MSEYNDSSSDNYSSSDYEEQSDPADNETTTDEEEYFREDITSDGADPSDISDPADNDTTSDEEEHSTKDLTIFNIDHMSDSEDISDACSDKEEPRDIIEKQTIMFVPENNIWTCDTCQALSFLYIIKPSEPHSTTIANRQISPPVVDISESEDEMVPERHCPLPTAPIISTKDAETQTSMVEDANVREFVLALLTGLNNSLKESTE